MTIFNRVRKEPGRELVPVDDVVGNLPFIVRRDHRIVAAFARKLAAEEWAQGRSFSDESKPLYRAHGSRSVVRVSGRRGGEMIAVLVITAALMVVLLWADRRARFYASPIILSYDAEADCDGARDDTEASCTSDDYNSSSAASDQR